MFYSGAGLEPGEGVGKREFPVAELFKPQGLKTQSRLCRDE